MEDRALFGNRLWLEETRHNDDVDDVDDDDDDDNSNPCFTTLSIILFETTGVSLVILVLSIVIASTQDGGVHSYVHGDL